MLYDIVMHVRNIFPDKNITGTFEVIDGALDLPIKDGQYFIITEDATNSIFNIGVHKYPCTNLSQETFEGTITAMKIPQAVIDLAEEVEEFVKTNKPSQYQAESFGGYSYTKATNSSGNTIGWQDAFKERLDTWRKI